MVLKAVCWRDGLIHGRFHGPHDTHCAVGSFFDVNPNVSLPVALIDEIAAVNDSVPRYTARARKAHVTRWLKWRLTELGMPGFAPRKRKKVRRG